MIHAAKIDENYSADEEKIIRQTLVKIKPDIKDIENIIINAKKAEADANQILNFTKQVNEKGKEPSKVTLKFCPDHYRVYLDEVIPAMPLKYRILTKIALKLGAIQIEQLKYMESELCFYCKFGSGGHDKKTELPPM